MIEDAMILDTMRFDGSEAGAEAVATWIASSMVEARPDRLPSGVQIVRFDAVHGRPWLYPGEEVVRTLGNDFYIKGS